MLTPAYALTATERVLPRLTIDFTTAVLDSRITFSRALNTATSISSSGLVELVNADVPRFVHTLGTASACRGLLIEPAATNRFQYSQDFSNAYWYKSGIASVDPVSDVAPDGTTTANLVTFSGTPGSNQNLFNFDTLTGTYTHSFFFKAKDANDVGKTVRVDTTGAGAGSVTVTLSSVWQRFSVTNNPTGYFQIRVISAPGFTADKFLLWGAQQEAGRLTSYIPNTGTGTKTRNADVAVMTGTNFSSWWAATGGAVALDIIPSNVDDIRPILQFDDATTDNIIALRNNVANPELYVKATTDQAQLDAGTATANVLNTMTGGWSTNDAATAIGGGAAVASSTITIPAVTQARLGSDGTNYFSGIYQTLRYWPQRLTNAELQAFSKR